MNDAGEVGARRRQLLEHLLPNGVPGLWCPILTHYRSDGVVDEERFLAHLEHVASWLDGILVPGSTGDGWELTEAERLRVLGLVLDQATRLKIRVLVGVLKRTEAAMLASLVGTVEWLKTRGGESDLLRCLVRLRVGGFALCGPSGAHLGQPQLAEAMERLLESGLPVAFYQLPQVTGNELEPATVAQLAEHHSNLVMLKDSSGLDRVAMSGVPLPGMVLLRGAEGDYARWLLMAGGKYDGLLLSSANVFPKEFRHLLRSLERGRVRAATELSERLTRVVQGVFHSLDGSGLVGNPFSHANKAMDHFMAFGPGATQVDPPVLHGRQHMPSRVLERTAELLKEHELMPVKGYLD